MSACSGADSDLLTDAPDKAGELPRDRHADLVVLQTAGGQPAIAMTEPQLRPPGDVADRGGLSFLALLLSQADAGRVAVVPGGLDQHPPCMTVASLGDRPERALLTAGVFTGHQPQIAHQLARARKALQFSQFGHQADSDQFVHAAQRHQRLYQGTHPPVLQVPESVPE